MTENNGLIFAFALNGNGGGKNISLSEVNQWQADDTILWIHMDYTDEVSKEWLENDSKIDPIIVEALSAEETRPRSLAHNGGLLVILRGVNLNPGTDPEDMISTRIWIDANRIITLRHRRVMAIDDLRHSVETGNGPLNTGEFLENLADRMIERTSVVISNIEDTVDELEEEVIAEQTYELRKKIADIRRSAISMRRYLAPQRDVMAHLYMEKADWLNEIERMRLREISDRTTKFVEDLDAIRDRATVTQEEISGHLAEQMNKTMYILSIVAGIFMPLGLLTGLFGINVGGMPGTNNNWAFTIFCIALLIIGVIQIFLFKKKKWM